MSDCIVPSGSAPMPSGAIVLPAETPCLVGDPVRADNGTFETGYAWAYEAVAEPYVGAFGEGYDLGPGTVECAILMLTTVPGVYHGQGLDIYIWSGGVSDAPGEVLAMAPGIVLDNIPFWPNIGRNEAEMSVVVEGAFTVGYWPNWPDQQIGFYCAVDQDGAKHHPWTYIVEGLEFPSGWQDPSIVWQETASMGLGVKFSPRAASVDEADADPTPLPGPTWGAVKALFGK
jgi:hypothetical protein